MTQNDVARELMDRAIQQLTLNHRALDTNEERLMTQLRAATEGPSAGAIFLAYDIGKLRALVYSPLAASACGAIVHILAGVSARVSGLDTSVEEADFRAARTLIKAA